MSIIIPSSISAQSDEPYFTNEKISLDDDIYPHHVEPTLAIDGDNIYAGWKNSDTHDGGGIRVSYTYSIDKGETWKIPIDMPHFEGVITGQSDPWMVYSHETLYYIYLEYSRLDNTISQITMASTKDKGTNWNIVRATNGTGFADKETFDVDSGGIIYLGYDDILSDRSDMRLSRSFDGGNTFVDNVTIMDRSGPEYIGPYILAGQTKGTIYTSFTYLTDFPATSDVYFDKSTDYGNTWGVDTDINPTSNGSAFTRGASGKPAKVTLTAMKQDSNGRLYVIWEDISRDGTTFDIFMRYSDNSGTSWSDKIMINENVLGDQWMPDIDIDSQNVVHIAYYEDLGAGAYEVKYRTFENGILSDEIAVSEPTDSSFTRPGDYLTIRVDKNNIPHLVWSDGREGVMDVFYGHLVVPVIEITSTTPVTSTTEENNFYFVFISPIALLILKRKKFLV